MPESPDAELISRILDDDLDPEERLQVAKRLGSDAAFAAEVRDHLRLTHLVHAELTAEARKSLSQRIRWSVTQRRSSKRHARIQVLRRQVRLRRTRRGTLLLFVTLGAAAAAAVLAVTLLPSNSVAGPPPDAIVESGGNGRRDLRRGETLDCGSAACVLRLTHDAGSRITLEPGSSLALAEGTGPLPLFDLRRGELRCEAEPQQAGRPLVFGAGATRSTIVGTAFRLRHDSQLAELQVEHGSVRFDDNSSQTVTVGPGQGVRSLGAGLMQRFLADRSLIDDGSGYTGCTWECTANPSSQVTLTSEKRPDGSPQHRLIYHLRQDADLHMWGQIQLVLPSVDGSGWDGFSFRVEGRGDGRSLVLGVLETSAAGSEFWTAERIDTQPGWQTIQVRWSELRRSTSYQMPGAPDDGFSPKRIEALYIQVLRQHDAGPTDGDLVVTEPRWRVRPGL